MGSTPSTEIQTVLDKLKSRGVSDKDIESFLSYIKQNTIDYEWIVNDISDKSKSKLYTYFEDELNNDTLFDTLCSIITNKDKSSKKFERAKKDAEIGFKHKRNLESSRRKLKSLDRAMRTQCSFSPSIRHLSYPMSRSSTHNSSHCFNPARSGRSCSALVSMDSIGLSLGGARDTNNFRKCIDKKVMPSVNSITYNGLLYEYYFDTGTISRKHEPKLDETTENKDECALFYPSYCYAKINKLSFDDKMDNNDHEREYFMSVGLNSNVKQNEFKRKHLNVLILLDISGSMTASFDDDNASFDVITFLHNNLINMWHRISYIRVFIAGTKSPPIHH